MNNNFWEKINKPVYALAPMAGFTDSAFRQICREYGADVVYSEMASVTALVFAPEKTLELVSYNKKEAPYVVQLFGSNPEHFAKATRIITEKIKPQGIDINFGCPVKKVQKQGAGAVLMNNLSLSREIIKAVIDNTDLPVSIKTRTRVGDVDVLQFLENVQDLDIKAVMIHGRTLAQGFAGPIDTQIIKKVTAKAGQARKYFSGVILTNGGIIKGEDIAEVLKKTGADGVGIARGALGQPWIFDKKIKESPNKEKIFKIALKHAKLARKLKGKQGIIEMRKHLCWYVAGLEGASGLRKKLVLVETLDDIKEILK